MFPIAFDISPKHTMSIDRTAYCGSHLAQYSNRVTAGETMVLIVDGNPKKWCARMEQFHSICLRHLIR